MTTVVGKDSSVVKRCTCRNCASIIEYVLYDTWEQVETDYTGSREYVKYITCPNCHKNLRV